MNRLRPQITGIAVGLSIAIFGGLADARRPPAVAVRTIWKEGIKHSWQHPVPILPPISINKTLNAASDVDVVQARESQGRWASWMTCPGSTACHKDFEVRLVIPCRAHRKVGQRMPTASLQPRWNSTD